METIRQDKFPPTPETISEGLVRILRDLKKTVDAEQKRKEHWLSSTVGDADDVIQHGRDEGQDKYGWDPDAFARPTNLRKPANLADAVQKASLVRFFVMIL